MISNDFPLAFGLIPFFVCASRKMFNQTVHIHLLVEHFARRLPFKISLNLNARHYFETNAKIQPTEGNQFFFSVFDTV